MNVLITGADGFLGQNLLKKIIYDNANILAIVYKTPVGFIDHVENKIKFIEIDLSKNVNFELILKNYDIDTVIHCAYLTTIDTFDDFNELGITDNGIQLLNDYALRLNYRGNSITLKKNLEIFQCL